jgi:outer membrane receptor for ferrienterochelin and colicins
MTPASRRICRSPSGQSGYVATLVLLLAAGFDARPAWPQQNAETAEEDDERSNLDSIVVTATRSGQLVRDQPVRVEVVPDEEIKESLTVAPGNLTNILNELAGVRMQAAAPGLGGTALQFRGLPGRHAQILSDGLPLGGAQSDSFSLMQTPPVDLAQVEVIKGVASAYYGGSALSGVLNLTSRGPGDASEVIVNKTSVGGSDAVGFLALPASQRLGFTLTGGAHYQSREDADHDGWAELPGYTRASLRPRFFRENAQGEKFFATVGVMRENREGGTLNGRALPSGDAFPEALYTSRIDAGTTALFKDRPSHLASLRWSANITERDRVFGSNRVRDKRGSAFGEATFSGQAGIHNWLVGAAFQYEELRVPNVAGVGYTWWVPAVFIQDEFAASDWLSLAGSARVDAHSDFGTFLSPRLSALFRVGSRWSVRASAGTGFSAPTPLIEEVEARSIGLVNPLHGLQAERAQSVSIDVKWALSPLDVNVSVFASQVRHPLDVEEAAQPGRLELINREGPLKSRGAEALIGYSTGPIHLLANATFLDVTEEAPVSGRRDTALVPRFTAELAGILEDDDLGRAGIEISYTGPQSLWDNPYAERSRSYVEINALAELRFGRAAIFMNAMNLTNVRQQRTTPLLRLAPGPGGDPLIDVWGPLIGRTYNIGIRMKM